MSRALNARPGFKPRNDKEKLVAYLKMGVGRFGTFQQTFQLPRDGSVDTEKVCHATVVYCLSLNGWYWLGGRSDISTWLIKSCCPKDYFDYCAKTNAARYKYCITEFFWSLDPFARYGRGYPQQRPLGNRGFFQDPSVWWWIHEYCQEIRIFLSCVCFQD